MVSWGILGDTLETLLWGIIEWVKFEGASTEFGT